MTLLCSATYYPSGSVSLSPRWLDSGRLEEAGKCTPTYPAYWGVAWPGGGAQAPTVSSGEVW